MKKLLILYTILIGLFLLFSASYFSKETSLNSLGEMDSGLRGEIHETYYMVTFQSGIDYWKTALKGFEDAAHALNVSVEYRGATQYDVNEQITVLEQVIAKKPAGIALSVINAEALTPTINKAIDAGIPVVLFDSGAPQSKAFSFLGTSNYSAGIKAAHKMAELLGEKGEVAVVTLPNQLNHQERTRGFIDTLIKEYPQMVYLATKDGRGDLMVSRGAALEIMDSYPEVDGIFNTDAVGGAGVAQAVLEAKKSIKIIGFDTDKNTLDLVKEGTISATLAQGTWNMGYWSLMYLFHLQHGKTNMVSETPTDMISVPPYVDTGVTLVTKENVDQYYAK